MKTPFQILIALLFCSTVYAQSDYQISYSFNDYYSLGNDIIVEKEGQVFVSNLYHKQNGELIPYSKPSSMMSVTKTDEYGNVIWNKAMENGYDFNDAARIVKTLEDEYIVAEGFLYTSDENSFLALNVTKLDDQGQQLWSKVYGPGKLLSMKLKPNGNLVILSYNDSYASTNSSSTVYQLIELNQGGQIVHSRFIKTPTSDFNMVNGSFEVLEDNTVVFATSSYTGYVFVRKYDAQLNMEWNRLLEVEDYYLYKPVLSINENHDIIIGADLYDGYSNEKAITLISITSNGDLSPHWTVQKIVSTDQSQVYITDLDCERGNYYISGWNYHSPQNQGVINPSNSIVSPFRIMVNNNTTSAVRFYNNSALHPGYLQNSDVDEGHWASIGAYQKHNNYKNKNIWLTRTQNMNSSHCTESEFTLVQLELRPKLTTLEPEYFELDYMTLSIPMNVFDKEIQKVYCPLLSIALEEEPEAEVASVTSPNTTTKVYPNPSKGHLNVELSDLFNPEERIAISILNILGQEIKSFETLNHRMNLNLSDLPHGQYILLARQHETIDQHKIIIH